MARAYEASIDYGLIGVDHYTSEDILGITAKAMA